MAEAASEPNDLATTMGYVRRILRLRALVLLGQFIFAFQLLVTLGFALLTVILAIANCWLESVLVLVMALYCGAQGGNLWFEVRVLRDEVVALSSRFAERMALHLRCYADDIDTSPRTLKRLRNLIPALRLEEP